jgi:hypothetical protein
MRPRDGIDDELGRCLREIAEGPLGGPDPPILERRSGMKLATSINRVGGSPGPIPTGLQQVVTPRGHDVPTVSGAN